MRGLVLLDELDEVEELAEDLDEIDEVEELAEDADEIDEVEELAEEADEADEVEELAEEADEVDLSFYFGDSIEEEALISIPSSEKGRQFDAQYPTEDVLKRCCIMKDFGEQTSKVEAMWARVKRA